MVEIGRQEPAGSGRKAALLFTVTPVAQEASRRSQTAATGNEEARMTNDKGMTKHECNVPALARAHARNWTSEVSGLRSEGVAVWKWPAALLEGHTSGP